MIPRIIRNDDNSSAAPGAVFAQVSHIGMKALRVKAVRFPPEDKLSIAQAHGAEVADATSCRMMQNDGVLFLWCYPHATPRSVLLKMYFIRGPEINARITEHSSYASGKPT